VVLYGAPFKNTETIGTLLNECIEDLNDNDIRDLLDKSNNAKGKGIILITTIDEKKATRYCQNLVENGLNATIE
jgi:hypothetical protein